MDHIAVAAEPRTVPAQPVSLALILFWKPCYQQRHHSPRKSQLFEFFPFPLPFLSLLPLTVTITFYYYFFQQEVS
jgi:hypothetical protein